jgi:hypothetical protein
MTPREYDELSFVKMLAAFVSNGQMPQAAAGQQLIERYASFDAEGRAALRTAVSTQRQYAMQLAENLTQFDSIDLNS